MGKQIAITLTTELHDKMRERKKKTGMDKTNQVRQALTEYLDL